MGSFNENFKNWPIKKKLLISHGSIIILTFVLIVSLLVGLKSVESNMVSLFEGPTTSTFYIGDIRFALADNQRAINRIIAVGKSVATEEIANLEENYNLMKSAHAVLEETLTTKEGKALLEDVWEVLEKEATYREQIVELVNTGTLSGLNTYDENYYTPLVEEIRELADKLDEQIFSNGEAYCNTSKSTANTLLVIGIVLLIGITAFAIFMAMKATKAIVAPVQELEVASKRLYAGDMSASKMITYHSKDELGSLGESLGASMDTLGEWVEEISGVLKEMAQGDLTRPFKNITDFRGDFSSIKESFVLILKNFNNILLQIKSTSKQVDVGSDEIANAASDLSEGTGEQASAVEQLNATISTVSNMAETSAKQAEDAYTNVLKSVDLAEEERVQMQQLEAEMSYIKEISGEIEAIITTIEEIASQTSLLALNASIEAARAGDAGRGFAVVADQIGKLATDSGQAVVNTRALIEKTVQEIEKGNKITQETAVAFEKIITEMQSFATVAKEVNENAENQAIALRQVEGGIEQISTVTQQNAASSEECSAVGEELAARATELDNLVGTFKLYE